MAEMLLINPRRRRKAKRAAPARRRRNPLALARVVHRRRRRRNPIAAVARRRRRNPIGMMKRRVMRRRNPSMLGGNYMTAIREALMDGFGAVAIDYAYHMIAKAIPGTAGSFLTPTATVGAADAVKAVLTVVLGNALNGVTRGFSRKAAKASLTVQSYQIMKKVLPAQITSNLSGVGYYSPAMIASGGNTRVGPIRGQMGAYLPSGSSTPLLSAYTASGSASPLLSGSGARMREGTSLYR